MRIELFLDDINQDIIRRPRATGGALGKTHPPVNASGGWGWEKVICCVLDFAKSQAAEKHDRPMTGLSMRKEEFGGLLWDATSGHVYKLDDEAFNLLSDLDEAKDFGPVREKYGLTEQELHDVLRQVGRATDR